MFRHARVYYRRINGRLILRLNVLVPEGDGWERRARIVARIVGELHLHLYDLEPKENRDG